MHKLTPLFAFLIIIGCTSVPSFVPKSYTIDQFFDNKAVGGGAFSPDESKLLVSSNETGIFNVFEIDIATGDRKQITESTEESFFAQDYVPGTSSILYSADKGGNEIDHIYLLQEDGTSIDLTPGEEEKTNFVGWNKAKDHLYYISNGRDNRFFDLLKMDVSNWEPTLLYQNNDGLDISDMSDDEQLYALTRTITTSSNKLYLFDKSTGNQTELSTVTGNYNGSGFSNDSKFFYYITDIGKEFAYLMEYEIATGNKRIVYEADWDVMYSYLSENEKYRVIAINEDGKNTLVVKDNKTGNDVDFPDIPGGDIVAASFADSETKIRLTIGTSQQPSNIYVYDFNSRELKQLTENLNPEINVEDLVSAEVVRFQSFDDLEIPAIYYKPHVASADQPVPALVWVHGGPGGQSRMGFSSLIQYLVNHGYAVLAVNNRGSSGYGKTFFKMDDLNHGDKDLKDCIWGKKWLESQDYVDAGKIGIIGGSYGGYMTMAAMTFAPDEFEVGVNIFGVTNWIRTLKSIPPFWEAFRDALYKELGDPYSQDSVRLHEISPLFHAENVKKPLMVLQGANDPRVLQVESDEIVAAVKKNDVPVEYVVFPDEGHGFLKKENQIKGYGNILTFLDTHLKKELKQ